MATTADPSSAYSGKRVLVAGGAGAIGSVVTRLLVEAGAEVIVLDDLSSGYRWNLVDDPNVLLVEGSILDETALRRVFAERPTIVFHLAAFFANQRSVDYPERDLMVNGLGTLRLLEHAALVGVDRVVYTSSSSVYGDSPSLPARETDVTLALNTPYQITKLLGEMYGEWFRRHHDLPVVSVRLFNSYGPGEVPGQYRNVIPNFFYWAMNNIALPLTGTGDETREFTFVEDVAAGLLSCGVTDAAVGHVMNLAGGREVPIGEIAERIVALTGSTAGVRFAPSRKWDTKKRLHAATDLATSVLGFTPQVDLDEGMRRTHEWFQQHWDRIAAAASFGPGASAALRG